MDAKGKTDKRKRKAIVKTAEKYERFSLYVLQNHHFFCKPPITRHPPSHETNKKKEKRKKRKNICGWFNATDSSVFRIQLVQAVQNIFTFHHLLHC